ncbi:hypothetical protein [Bacillus piscicola]|uniref:hypothetical protein n=1 Tax=Bacillus piscicola TaxID=1632684 RepID=UPI001F093FC7|nr:hypothetical protein [Bacillus piscicola]
MEVKKDKVMQSLSNIKEIEDVRFLLEKENNLYFTALMSDIYSKEYIVIKIDGEGKLFKQHPFFLHLDKWKYCATI